MDSNQSVAKIGVFVLLAVNVGAYYYFWPRPNDAAKNVAKAAAQEKGETQLRAPKISAKPKHMPTERDAVRLAITNPPALPGERNVYPEIRIGSNTSAATLKVFEQPPADGAFKLAEHIDKDKPPELPTFPMAGSAKLEGPAKIEVAGVIPVLPTDPAVAVASPLTPKMPPGLWQHQIEKIGNRTHLTARLRDPAGERVVAEFHIVGDRVEVNPQTGKIKALGNVSFNGAGWKGTCQSVTLPIHEQRLVFEGEARVSQDVLGSSQDGGLRGERIVWELPTQPTTGVNGVTLPLNR